MPSPVQVAKRLTVAAVAIAAVVLTTSTAYAHQHLFAPSGSCPSSSSSVPQGLDNPGGQTPGGRNNAAEHEQGSTNCRGGR